MTHEKTVQAYKDAGLGWTSLNETASDVALAAKKQLIQFDKNPTVIVNNVYRLRVEQPAPSTEVSEFILFDKTTTGHSGLGNPVTYYETTDDLGLYREPITTTITRFNPETEQTEQIVDQSDVKLKVHYLYKF